MNLTITPRMNNNLAQPQKVAQKVAFGNGHIPCLEVRQIQARLPLAKLEWFKQAQERAKSLVSGVPSYLKPDPTDRAQILTLKNLQSFFGGIQSGNEFHVSNIETRMDFIGLAIDSLLKKNKKSQPPVPLIEAQRLVKSVPRFLKYNPNEQEEMQALQKFQEFIANIRNKDNFKGLSVQERIFLIRDAISARIEELKSIPTPPRNDV